MPLIEMTLSSDIMIACRGVCREDLSSLSLLGLNTVANEGKCRAWLPVAWWPVTTQASGQGRECKLCVESPSSHTHCLSDPFRSQIQTLRCLNLKLLNNRALSSLDSEYSDRNDTLGAWLSYFEHVTRVSLDPSANWPQPLAGLNPLSSHWPSVALTSARDQGQLGAWSGKTSPSSRYLVILSLDKFLSGIKYAVNGCY